MFSKRTNWDLHPNRLTQLIDERRSQGLPIIDLTESNPTKCEFDYHANEMLDALVEEDNLVYKPNPKGSMKARQTISGYYNEMRITVNPEQIFLTSSTSESYNFIFRLLMDVGDEILIPQPSYPLLDYIAQINDARVKYYKLLYDDEWHIDFHSLRDAISKKTKAILVIHPNNPTGSYVKKDEYSALVEIAANNNLAIISDEVFLEYPFYSDSRRTKSFADTDSVLTFTLNGISKMLGLPQMKLGWIVVKGGGKKSDVASTRLEVLTDTFLPVSSPIQNALSKWMSNRRRISHQIINRTRENYEALIECVKNYPLLQVYKIEGGWNAIIKLPYNTLTEDLSEYLVTKYGVIVQPGYFYDFVKNDHIVIGLIVKKGVFKLGIETIAGEIQKL
jgi:hypothetical protein